MLFPPITPTELAAVIEAHYDLQLRAPPKPLRSGAHSIAWRIVTYTRNWVAKLSNPRSDSFAKLEQQAQLYQFLNANGMHAPDFLALRNGTLVGKLTIGHVDYPLQLMQAQVLQKVAPETAPASTLVFIGRLAAQLHHALASYPDKQQFIIDTHKSKNEWGQQQYGLCKIIDSMPSSIAPDAAARAWLGGVDQRAMQYLQRCYPDPATLSCALLHGDLNFEHIQFLADGTPYIFDFGDLNWGPIAHELAVFLQTSYRDSTLALAQWQALQAQLLAGYCAEHALTAHDQAMVPVFLVNRIIGQARYIIELMADAQRDIPWKVIQRTYTLAEYLLQQG